MSSYDLAIQFLFNLTCDRNPEPVNSMRVLSALLGNPHACYKIIHITGTNGKGTVATQCAAVLKSAGYKTGLMTSPHIIDFCERIQINFEKIHEDYIGENVPHIKNLILENNIPMSYALIVSALGFKYFAENSVDWAVIEVGCGATHDYSNIVDPEISVITSVGLDHCNLFGNTVEDIAREKSGIIKNNKPIVIGPNCPVEQLRKVSEERGSAFYCVDRGITYETYEEENSNITQQIFRVLDLGIRQEKIEEGIRNRAPLRKQILDFNGKTVILDVGHNPMALERVFTDLAHTFKNKRIRVLFAMAKKRSPEVLLPIVLSFASILHLTSSGHSMLVEYLNLQEIAAKINPEKVSYSGNLSAILPRILKEMSHEEILVINGSFYIMEAAKLCLESLGLSININL